MRAFKFRPFLMTILGLSLMASACGPLGGSSPAAQQKGNVTAAGFNFNESSILMYIYGKALQNKGYTVTFKPNLGNREIVAPALAKGDIDFYLGYTATDLEFYNKGKGEAASDPQANADKLNGYLKSAGAQALKPSGASDQDAFAVTKETAAKYNLKKLSDLTAQSDKLVLGGPAECPTRPYCQPGLDKTYGTHFKSFKALDAGGPLTKGALSQGSIDVALVFSSDGAIAARGFVVLQDDKHLESADNIVPIIRSKAATSEVVSLFNDISAKLTLDDLTAMNKSADVDKQDPDALASDWLKKHGFTK